MASKRGYRTIPIADKTGVIRRRRVKTENLGKYGVVVMNKHGRKAYVKKDAEVRVIEARRRAPAPLTQVRIHAKTAYDAKAKGHDFNAEATIVATIPAGEEDAFSAYFEATVRGLMDSAGLPGTTELEFGLEWTKPTSGVLVAINSLDVSIRDNPNDFAAGQLRDQLEPWFAQRQGLESVPEPGLIAGMRRAKLDAKSGRYRDPKTGRFTLNPELL